MSTQLQTNRIVPRSILRYRPIAPDDIPTWQRRPAHSCAPETGAFASSAALAAIVVCGMGIALLLILLGQLVTGWAQITWDDWHYGRPRISQADQYVGHEQAGQPPSHFLALNNRGRIEVIELPGDDPTRARILSSLGRTLILSRRRSTFPIRITHTIRTWSWMLAICPSSSTIRTGHLSLSAVRPDKTRQVPL